MAGAPPCISHFSGTVSVGRVQNEAQHTKNKKMAGAPPSISHSSGAVSAGRVQNGGRSVLYFSLFGSRFCRQSSFCAGRVEFLFMFPASPARICSY